MSDEWISTKEAARLLNISLRQVVDRIHKGRLRAKRDGRRWLVHVSLSPPAEEAEGGLEAAEDLRSSLEILREQLREKDKQIERLQMITMQLSRDIESQQKLIEYKHAPWWRRWFKK